MPTIIDINVLHKVFGGSDFPEYKPVLEALYLRTAVAVSGGKHRRDISKARKYSGVIRELNRVGAWKFHNDADVDDEEQRIKALNVLKSNDPEIIALARVSRSRLLVSEDQKLHTDFKNRKLINPRGRVYTGLQQKKLLANLGA